jgi:hypothetical protein
MDIDEFSIRKLLDDVSSIHETYEQIARKTGNRFNIFDIEEISSAEVAICRVLYELLSPKGNHFQGTRYLVLFFETIREVLEEHDVRVPSESEIEKAEVFKEKPTPEGRRIDLVIEIENFCIPIEVKIGAGDQPRQCYDYFCYAKGQNPSTEKTWMLYLTRTGCAPSPYSAEDPTKEGDGPTKDKDGYKEVCQISFEKDILNWLKACLTQEETIKAAPIREILLQFMSVIRRFTNQMEDEEKMELVELLSDSSDNMKNAKIVNDAAKICKVNIMRDFLQALDKKLLEKGFKTQNKFKIYDHNDSTGSDQVNRYYDKSTYPGITYLIKLDVKSDIHLFFRVEIEASGALIGGFIAVKEGERQQRRDFFDGVDEFGKFFSAEPNPSQTWLHYEEVHINGNSALNFKTNNETYYSLFDKKPELNKFDDLVEKCSESLDAIRKKCVYWNE